ncbi:MAG TPA: hypothetical protein VFZ53_18045, partial [Polyangiaceae bacterium]
MLSVSVFPTPPLAAGFGASLVFFARDSLGRSVARGSVAASGFGALFAEGAAGSGSARGTTSTAGGGGGVAEVSAGALLARGEERGASLVR